MKIEIEIVLIGILLLVLVDLVLFFRLFLNKAKGVLKRQQEKEYRAASAKPRRGLAGTCRALSSPFRIRRTRAAVELGIIGTEEARIALEKALQRERRFPVKLYMANALTDIGHERSVPFLVDSLLGAHRWYRTKVNMLIAEFGSKLDPYIAPLLPREEEEIRELLIDVASVYISAELKEYLFRLLKECRDERLTQKAAEAAAIFYFYDLAGEEYRQHAFPSVRKAAVRALGNVDSKESFFILKGLLSDPLVCKNALSALSSLIARDPRYIPMTVEAFRMEKDPSVREQLAEALSGRIEYFIMKLTSPEREEASGIIRQLLRLGKTSEMIGFLNKNKDIEMENILLSLVTESVCGKPGSETIEKEFCTYLHDRLLKKAGLIRCERLLAQKPRERDPVFVRVLYTLLVATLIFFPIAYLLINLPTMLDWPLLFHLKQYVIDYNYFLVLYSVAINMIYLVLLFFSRLNVSRQIKLWSCKNRRMLFRRRMLPGVSIIAPAYNEEAVIIESANSLLNLSYPDYEVIFVNDGSADNTLGTLVEYFDLKRIDYNYEKKLNTEPIRGVYTNPSYPKLLVVDKENGGKADSLNAGIVISQKEYFCCIDSDSLLEDEALLRLASQTLDEGIETPALGGNVFPVNGCTVQRGYLSEIRIPDNHLARFQTIEYIRAFMAGRLGWAYLNGLLIISGAFGLFRKERVIDVGGYLTSNEKYKKDTVGEDMELVVRICALMRKKKLKYRIDYCYNANCWTEVPEDLGALRRQRYRWHRGLIEILHFHRKTLFNPRYGKMGMLSMPYFFLFEMIGPLIEVQGYLMIVIAFFMDILNWEIALLLFASSILLGVVVSVASLGIAEKDDAYFSYGDVLKLVHYAVIENFGVRQLFSLWRVIGYLKMFSKSHGWGKQVRKGFAAKQMGSEGVL